MGAQKKAAASARQEAKELDNTARTFGAGSRNLKLVAELLGLNVSQRGHQWNFSGGTAHKQALADRAMKALAAMAAEGMDPDEWDVECLVNLAEREPGDLAEFIRPRTRGWKKVSARTPGQKSYLEAIESHDLVFGLGPAGTGKTYLAVAMAVSALAEGRVSRLILTRPAVEAGERLGFLPGDLAEKINPYLRPLYDALGDLVPYEKYVKLAERRVIEVAPLAFMRGRTLTDAFVILDEAQNSTHEQMKMFLTRLGPKSKAVVTGDLSQSDLPSGTASGLAEAVRILGGIEGVAFLRFTGGDVVRHRLVKKIIAAYELAEKDLAEKGRSRPESGPASGRARRKEQE